MGDSQILFSSTYNCINTILIFGMQNESPTFNVHQRMIMLQVFCVIEELTIKLRGTWITDISNYSSERADQCCQIHKL